MSVPRGVERSVSSQASNNVPDVLNRFGFFICLRANIKQGPCRAQPHLFADADGNFYTEVSASVQPLRISNTI